MERRIGRVGKGGRAKGLKGTGGGGRAEGKERKGKGQVWNKGRTVKIA